MNNAYIIALLKCKGIGNTKLLDYLIKQNFDIVNIKRNINKIINNEDYENFDTLLKKSNVEIEKNLQKGINLITILDENYPSKLYTINDPILYLYYKGNIDLINLPSVAVIGTRKPNDNSMIDTDKLITDLVKEDYVIVSGLALGIDTIAHQKCIDNNGKTIAVLPSSIDNIQPSSNKILANKILEKNGCLITEYPVGSLLNKFNYAKRDRIQSALSNVIITPEADEESGTMIAINKSIKENKPVYQFISNRNKKINKAIDIYDKNFINIIKNSIDNDIKLEVRKRNYITNKIKQGDQMSLF